MKKWIALLLAAVLCLSLAACGGNENEVELTPENILDYLNIEITYENTGKKNILGQPEMVETITIYPVQGGSFKNVKLLITGFPKEWTAASSELGSSFAQNAGSFKPSRDLFGLFHDAALVGRDGDDDDLDGGDGRRQHKSAVVTVAHDDAADDAGRQTP